MAAPVAGPTAAPLLLAAGGYLNRSRLFLLSLALQKRGEDRPFDLLVSGLEAVQLAANSVSCYPFVLGQDIPPL